ncbi:TetR-like C-terminal domain-containing protein [Micromonospora sp. NPDC005215]|uniref:TetR-like C-terminal domain-containing protein n=1 Tax=Micromonospora sp. NPDC005215 TaxID=3157024 RepID=UPI0033B7E0D5
MTPISATDNVAPAPVKRRRGDVLVRAILRAVIEQLETLGYAKLSVEGVAAAAGTGKAALYRRWSGKEELVAAALAEVLPSPAEVPRTGDTRADLIALLACMRDSFSQHGTAFQVVKAEAEAGEALLAGVVQQRVVQPCTEGIRARLAEAATRGELGVAATQPMLANVGPAMLIYHTLTRGIDIADDYLDHIVDDLILPAAR